MDTNLLSMLVDRGVKTIEIKGKDTEEYNRIVSVSFPEIDITTEDGRQTVVLNCSSLDEVTEIYINGDHSMSYKEDTIINYRRNDL